MILPINIIERVNMPFSSKLSDKFYSEDLATLCKTEPIAQVRLRYIGLSHIQEGESIERVAKMVRVRTKKQVNASN